MAIQYASEQPAGFKNHVENVAIVGAGGNVGSHFVASLLKTGKHTVTAITRAESTKKAVAGVKTAIVDYDKPESIVEALKGQDALIITMNTTAPKDTQFKLVEAAAAAGVPYVFPNEYGPDPTQTEMGKDILIEGVKPVVRARIEELSRSKWIALISNFWYEYSLSASPHCYGFDFKDRKVTFYDDGNTKINTSSWPQCGRAMASLLSLPRLPRDRDDRGLVLEKYANNFVYISSFDASQKDMFASVLRVTGDKESDWEASYESSKERFEDGKKALAEGNRLGFGKLLYSRVMYPDGCGNYESKGKLDNQDLGLPVENIDDLTKVALGMPKLF